MLVDVDEPRCEVGQEMAFTVAIQVNDGTSTSSPGHTDDSKEVQRLVAALVATPCPAPANAQMARSTPRSSGLCSALPAAAPCALPRPLPRPARASGTESDRQTDPWSSAASSGVHCLARTAEAQFQPETRHVAERVADHAQSTGRRDPDLASTIFRFL